MCIGVRTVCLAFGLFMRKSVFSNLNVKICKMTDSNEFNIREICRACLSDNKDNLRSIFDSNLRESFTLCTNVQVTDNDGLPNLICSSCVYKVISWVSFKSQCEQSDGILRTTFQFTEATEAKTTKSTGNERQDSKSGSDVCESNNDVTDVETLQQFSEFDDNWTADEVDNQIEQTLDDDDYENEETVGGTVDDDSDDGSDHSSVPLSKAADSKGTRSSPQKQVTCDECGTSFRNSDRLKSHQRCVHEGKKPEVCQICDKEFNNLRALRRHRLKHSDVKQFRCDECGRMYKYQTSLTLHKKGHANVRRFVCDLCGKSFVRAHGLQSHLLSHSTLTPFLCDFDACGKQFKNAIMLRNHQKRHLGIKTFICSHADCGKEFITSAELNTHIRSHTGAKPFACSICDKSYKTKSHLTVHYRSHSGARPYSCDICPLTFAHNKVLKHHRLVHLGQLPWICDVCLRPFRQRSTLMKHKKLHTNGKVPKGSAQSTDNSQSIELSIELENLEK